MGPRIRIGDRWLRYSALFVALLLSFVTPGIVWGQAPPLSCSVFGVPAQVRSEGLAERLGDIALQCSGGTSGTTVTTGLSLLLPANITNRVNPDSTAPDVQLTVNDIAGPLGQVSSRSISFNGIGLVVPSSGTVNVRVRNLRV